MDQEKIERLISQCRKDKNLTQAELADLLGVSDKSVSK
ncbi:MAG: helix-turn-helix domain-containing protein [Erysipelotrichaceae bacterium]|nr:helix-turn-helix domain-containing protein [Erysipelotrichaceae bacterium]